jgi:hypothetical protein
MTKLPDGVYLHQSEEDYFGDRTRLGGSDVCKLALYGEGYWWQSWLNPTKVETETTGKNVGKGLHAALGEGFVAYEQRFAVLPEKTDYKDLLVTVEQIRTALTERGFDPPSKWTKDPLVKFAQSRAPDLNVWDSIIEKFEEEAGERTCVTRAEDFQIRTMADMVHAHPELGQLLKPGPNNIILVEVSILYHDEHGIPRRARLDMMLPQLTIDWKTLANVGGQPLQFAVGTQLAKFGYHAQLADYQIARTHAYRLIEEGKIFGADADETAWLKRFPAEAKTFDFCFGFYQKPDPRVGHAPIFFPWYEDYGSELHKRGIRARIRALQTYRRCMAEFGPDKPWTRVEPIHTSAEGAVERVILPHWIGDDAYVAGEDEFL